MNKLFGLALEALDFTVRPILCRVPMGAPEGGPRTHQALIVTIEDCDWLADAGFPGPAPIASLRIDTKEQQIVGHDVFRLRADPASGDLVLERRNEDEWFALFGIDRAVALPPDFEGASFICARWDRMSFPSVLMMTSEGRATLLNRKLRLTRSQFKDHAFVKRLHPRSLRRRIA